MREMIVIRVIRGIRVMVAFGRQTLEPWIRGPGAGPGLQVWPAGGRLYLVAQDALRVGDGHVGGLHALAAGGVER